MKIASFGLFLLLLLPPTAAYADDVVVLWPFSVDRRVDERLTAKVLKSLSGLYSVHRVPSPPLLPPLAAASALRSSCPSETGTLLGGFVESKEFVKRARLWAVPRGADKPLVLDLYCARPECDLETMISESVVSLADPSPPKSVRPWSPQPSYCQSLSAPSPTPERSTKLVLAVYGDKLPKGFAALLHKDLSSSRTVESATIDKHFVPSKDLYKSLLGGDAKAQVLGVESTAEGMLLWLYDGLTDKAHQEPSFIKCPGCTPDKLASEVAAKAQSYLSHNFDSDSASAVLYQAPPLACQDFTEDLWNAPSGATNVNRHIDPNTAKWMKGAVWGLFAASAATTVTLAIFNETSVGDVTLDGRTYHHGLTRPTWVGFGLSALSLAVAVPTTVSAHRASLNQVRSGSSASAITCPTQ